MGPGVCPSCGPTNAFKFPYSEGAQERGWASQKLWALGQAQASWVVTMQILPGKALWVDKVGTGLGPRLPCLLAVTLMSNISSFLPA